MTRYILNICSISLKQEQSFPVPGFQLLSWNYYDTIISWNYYDTVNASVVSIELMYFT